VGVVKTKRGNTVKGGEAAGRQEDNNFNRVHFLEPHDVRKNWIAKLPVERGEREKLERARTQGKLTSVMLRGEKMNKNG